MNTEQLKELAAYSAVDFVRPGMTVGLGHGSTALYAIRRIAHLVRIGQLVDVRGVPCSAAAEKEAAQSGIPVEDWDGRLRIDLTIDGADEIDPDLNLIKGGGGALLREKIVAQASRREIIIIDDSKFSPFLGTRRAVPVEVVPFGWRSQALFLESLGAKASLRMNPDGNPFATDEGNYILDCYFGPISDPADIAERIRRRAGIVEHGIWVGIATDVIAASPQGLKYMKRESGAQKPHRRKRSA
jgi:ribose 5-phosphate isomerase A